MLESACGPCIGMGQAPASGAVSVRTFNRNFEGRSGTQDAKSTWSAPRSPRRPRSRRARPTRARSASPALRDFHDSARYDDNMIIATAGGWRGRGGAARPEHQAAAHDPACRTTLAGEVLLKVGDNITTDHIMPAGAQVLPLRSNIPAISEFVFERVDPTFAERAKAAGGGFIVGGANYGQGSSREHAALAPMYLGVRAVIAEELRAHPPGQPDQLRHPAPPLPEPADYDRLQQGMRLAFPEVGVRLRAGEPLELIAKGKERLVIPVIADLSPRRGWKWCWRAGC